VGVSLFSQVTRGKSQGNAPKLRWGDWTTGRTFTEKGWPGVGTG